MEKLHSYLFTLKGYEVLLLMFFDESFKLNLLYFGQNRMEIDMLAQFYESNLKNSF